VICYINIHPIMIHTYTVLFTPFWLCIISGTKRPIPPSPFLHKYQWHELVVARNDHHPNTHGLTAHFFQRRSGLCTGSLCAPITIRRAGTGNWIRRLVKDHYSFTSWYQFCLKRPKWSTPSPAGIVAVPHKKQKGCVCINGPESWGAMGPVRQPRHCLWRVSDKSRRNLWTHLGIYVD